MGGCDFFCCFVLGFFCYLFENKWHLNCVNTFMLSEVFPVETLVLNFHACFCKMGQSL